MRPCTNCVYLHVCGDTSRSEPCKGRQIKTEKQKEFAKLIDDLYNEFLDMDYKDYEEFECADKNYIEKLISKHGYNRAREILLSNE